MCEIQEHRTVVPSITVTSWALLNKGGGWGRGVIERRSNYGEKKATVIFYTDPSSDCSHSSILRQGMVVWSKRDRAGPNSSGRRSSGGTASLTFTSCNGGSSVRIIS